MYNYYIWMILMKNDQDDVDMNNQDIGKIEFGFGYLLENYPIHSDVFFELHYVYRGRGKLIIGDDSIDLSENSLYISPPNETHFVKVEDELLFHILRVTPARKDIDLWFDFCRKCRKSGGLQLSIAKRYEIGRIRELSGIDSDNARKAAWYGLQSILYEIFIPDIERRAISCDDRILKIIRYMEQKIEKRIRLEELGKLVFLTPTQVSRIFREEIGISPIEYFIRLKIDVACYFLSKNDYKNREISEMLSFSDEFHFSKVFKRKTGISPCVFRKKEAAEKKIIIEHLLSLESVERVIDRYHSEPIFHQKSK